jgi:dienelactone hydrolase
MVEQQSSTFEMETHKYEIDRYAEKNASAKRPVVVVFHGVDGTAGESGTEIRKFAEQIAGEGFLVFVPHYFDAADGADTLPLDQLFDLRVPRVGSYPARISAAVDYAQKQPDGDSGRLGLVGLSLGGGLAVDYAESVPPGTVNALVDYFGYIPDSKIYINAGLLPPTLILHNNADEIVKIIESSQLLLDSLDKTAVIHDHRFYDDANPARRNHPFLPGGLADVDSRSRSVAWLKTYLMPAS